MTYVAQISPYSFHNLPTSEYGYKFDHMIMEKPFIIYGTILIYYFICSAQSTNEAGRAAVRILNSQDLQLKHRKIS